MDPWGPVDLTAGPDGAMWFTYYCKPEIGRIDPTTHAVTNYTIPGLVASMQNSSISSGPDGAIWFTGALYNVIGRVAIQTSATLRRTHRAPPKRRHT